MGHAQEDYSESRLTNFRGMLTGLLSELLYEEDGYETLNDEDLGRLRKEYTKMIRSKNDVFT